MSRRLSPPHYPDKNMMRLVSKIYEDLNYILSLIDQTAQRGAVKDSDAPGKIGVEKNGEAYNLVINTKEGKVKGENILKKE